MLFIITDKITNRSLNQAHVKIFVIFESYKYAHSLNLMVFNIYLALRILFVVRLLYIFAHEVDDTDVVQYFGMLFSQRNKKIKI